MIDFHGYSERFMRRFWMIVLILAMAAIPGQAQQATPPTAVPVPADKFVLKKISPPQPLNNVEARYSEEAREKHINGRCIVSLIVDVTGIPQDINVFRCTDPSFEEPSLDAVGQYRFKPAMTQDGKPVPVKISIEIRYHIDPGSDPPTPIRYKFSAPPGTTTSGPGPDGVYPLTQQATPPTMIKFTDEGYGEIAFPAEGNSVCDIVYTINAKGKASDPQVIHCERPTLQKPAMLSLLKSHYKPGKVNGKAVPMRASIHLELADLSPDYSDLPPENADIPPEF